jgi:hypothetical protein
VVVGAEGEPSEIEEITEDQIQAESPQKDVEADAATDRCKSRHLR